MTVSSLLELCRGCNAVAFVDVPADMGFDQRCLPVARPLPVLGSREVYTADFLQFSTCSKSVAIVVTSSVVMPCADVLDLWV